MLVGLELMIACILWCYANHCTTSIDVRKSTEHILYVTVDVHHLAADV